MKRDSNRIKEVLDQLHQLWLQYPNLRLCQLLYFINDKDNDLFYIEDEELLRRIKIKRDRENNEKIKKNRHHARGITLCGSTLRSS